MFLRPAKNDFLCSSVSSGVKRLYLDTGGFSCKKLSLPNRGWEKLISIILAGPCYEGKKKVVKNGNIFFWKKYLC